MGNRCSCPLIISLYEKTYRGLKKYKFYKPGRKCLKFNQSKTKGSSAHRNINMNGMSKAYAMDGWRLGYIAVPEEYIWMSFAASYESIVEGCERWKTAVEQLRKN